MTDETRTDLFERIRGLTGPAAAPLAAPDPVNQPMIRHWCEALDDRNPVYTDPVFAARSVHGQVVAPPAMLPAWTIPAAAPRGVGSPITAAEVFRQLAAAGYTGVVGSTLSHEYHRYLKLGDSVTALYSVTEVSPEKQTALGAGHFVSTLAEFRAAGDELVGLLRLTLLAYKPGVADDTNAATSPAAAAPRPPRPRPGISHDTRFFWDGVNGGELRIQRCRRCATLHHPPRVRCHRCGSYDFDFAVSSGRGVVYSFVEPCHPRLPSFDYPYVVGLVELEEGTRLITNIVDIDVEKVEIGMPVELVFQAPDPDLVLPVFRPRRPPRRDTTLCFEDVRPGEELAPCPVPIGHRLIIAGAVASRDFSEIHHSDEAAIRRGLPGICLNATTSAGLCSRYLTDWAGPDAVVRRLDFRLGVPNFAHDTLTMSGTVRARDGETNRIEIALRAYNRRGDHVSGTAVLELPAKGGAR